jgi:hypothetical protein
MNMKLLTVLNFVDKPTFRGHFLNGFLNLWEKIRIAKDGTYARNPFKRKVSA